MGERIDQFCENLRIKLTSIDENLEALKAKVDGKARTAEHVSNLRDISGAFRSADFARYEETFRKAGLPD